MMGFGTARIVDPSGERDAQHELNAALTRQMDAFEKKKKKSVETEKIEERRKQQADKIRDEIRTMHEAYQFLAKKYISDKDRQQQQKQQLRASEEISGNLFEVDEKEETDEVFGIETVMSVKTAANIFKEQSGCKIETEDNNNFNGAHLEQSVNQ